MSIPFPSTLPDTIDFPGYFYKNVVHDYSEPNDFEKVKLWPFQERILKQIQASEKRKFRWVKLWATWTVARIETSDDDIRYFDIVGSKSYYIEVGGTLYIDGVKTNDEVIWGEWLATPA
jgi:hypothetical protein